MPQRRAGIEKHPVESGPAPAPSWRPARLQHFAATHATPRAYCAHSRFLGCEPAEVIRGAQAYSGKAGTPALEVGCDRGCKLQVGHDPTCGSACLECAHSGTCGRQGRCLLQSPCGAARRCRLATAPDLAGSARPRERNLSGTQPEDGGGRPRRDTEGLLARRQSELADGGSRDESCLNCAESPCEGSALGKSEEHRIKHVVLLEVPVSAQPAP